MWIFVYYGQCCALGCLLPLMAPPGQNINFSRNCPIYYSIFYNIWEKIDQLELIYPTHFEVQCQSRVNRDFVFRVWTNVTSASSPFAQSFSHAKAQQRSDNLPRPMMRQVRQRAAICCFFLCSSNQKVINRYVLYVKHTLIT